MIRWSPKQKHLLRRIYSKGNVFAIGAKRSGKTLAIAEAIRRSIFYWEPDVDGIIAAPTFGQLERNILSHLRQIVTPDLYTHIKDPKNPRIEFHVGGGKIVTVFLASAKRPGNIEGATVGWCAFTELQDGEGFWRVVRARVSDARANTLRRFGDGLPEEGWLTKESLSEDPAYDIVQFVLADNEQNLHPDYRRDMLSDITPREKLMYIDGQFVGAVDAVYPNFSRRNHASHPVSHKPGIRVLIGLDFNIEQQSAVFCQWYGGTLHVFDEIMEPGTAQDQASRITERLKKYRLAPKNVTLVPDASGKNRQHVNNKGESSIALLEASGFFVVRRGANPHISNRDTSVNVLLENAKGEHRIEIDPSCQKTIDSLAGFRNSDRTSMHSHACDALGYIVWHVAPVKRKQSFSVTQKDIESLPTIRGGRAR